MTNNVLHFPSKKPGETIETDSGLIDLMKRAVDEAFDGDEKEFERAYAEALTQQIIELHQACNGYPVDLSEELADAMRGVLLQWIGEYPCFPREDFDLLRSRYPLPS